jgi:hypothetical protein
MADPPQEIDTEELAAQVVDELDPGSVVNDKLVLSRRQVIALAGSGLGAGALATWATGDAAAAGGTNDTSVGDVGAAGDSVDVYLDELRDDGGDEVLDIDDTGEINAAFGRTWNYDTIAPSALGASLDIDGNNLTDAGATVYDASTDTVGDGTTSADHQSVNTDKARIGSADTVSGGPVGDAGDDVILDSEGPAPDTFETTSTTYVGFFGGGDEVVFNFFPLSSLTNIDDLGLGIAGEITNSDAQETTTVAILTNGEEFAEYSHTGDDIGKFYTAPDYTPTVNGVDRLVPRLKVSGGTGTVYNLRVIVWGEIK